MKTRMPHSSPRPPVARQVVAQAFPPAVSPTFLSAGGTPRPAASWHPAGRRLESLRSSRQECLRYDRAAFTRLELLAVLAGLVLLAAVAWPVLAGNRLASDRLGCLNNLRQIGMAYHLWGNDHGGALPCRTPHCEGGLRIHSQVCPSAPRPAWVGFINNAWFHYAWLSNELATPQLLACPGDAAVKLARDFSTSAAGGFLNPALRNNALSYLLALDAMPGQPLLFISGDYNVSVAGYYSGCSSGVTAAAGLPTVGGRLPYPWMPGPHGETGNLLLADGQVLPTSSAGLIRYLDTHVLAQGDNGNYHLLKPRP